MPSGAANSRWVGGPLRPSPPFSTRCVDVVCIAVRLSRKVPFAEKMGTAFYPVKADISGNIQVRGVTHTHTVFLEGSYTLTQVVVWVRNTACVLLRGWLTGVPQMSGGTAGASSPSCWTRCWPRRRRAPPPAPRACYGSSGGWVGPGHVSGCSTQCKTLPCLAHCCDPSSSPCLGPHACRPHGCHLHPSLASLPGTPLLSPPPLSLAPSLAPLSGSLWPCPLHFPPAWLMAVSAARPLERRAMEFMLALLQGVHDRPSDTLAKVVADTYTATLCQYHGFMVSSAFTVRVRDSVACRWRFWKFHTYAEASWMLPKITANSGMSALDQWEFLVILGGLQLICTIF